MVEIETKRDEKLATLDTYIQTLEEGLDGKALEYDELLNQAILHEREGKVPPEQLKANLRSAKREYEADEADLQKAKKERLKTATQFEDDIKRFRELKGL